MVESPTDRIQVRAATRDDVEAISRIINHPPEPPLARLLGSNRASRLGDLFVREGVSISIPDTVVAVIDGTVVGVMDCGSQHTVRIGVARIPRFVLRVLVTARSGIIRCIYGGWVRQRVQFEAVDGAFPIAELAVDEAMRNRGIGGHLLTYAEERARAGGRSVMCLETGITNPARRLYERHGFEVLATKADAGYERAMGSPGRVLMVKRLA